MLACRLAFAGLLAAPMAPALASCAVFSETDLSNCVTAGQPDIQISATILVSGAQVSTGGGGKTITTNGFSIVGNGLSVDNNDRVLANNPGSISKLTFNGDSSITAQSGVTLTIDGAMAIQTGATATFGTAGQSGTILYTSTGGSQIFGGANGIEVAGGTLRGTTTQLGLLTGGIGYTNIHSGAMIDFGSNSAAFIQLLGNGTVNMTGSANVLTIGDGTTFGGVYQGTAGLATTAGAMTLTGANTYSGATHMVAGSRLDLLAANSLSANSAFNMVNGALLRLDNFSQEVASLAGTGGSINLFGGTLTTGGDNSSTTFSGTITGTGGGLTKTGTGTFTLGGSNSYTGATTINGGTLVAGAAGAINSSSALTVAGGATFDMTGFDQSVASLAGAGTVAMGSKQLTVGGDNTSTTFDGVFSSAGAALVKTGAGTLTLTDSSSSFNGTANVSTGTLAAWGGALSNSAVTIASGATLDISHDGQVVQAVTGAGNINLGSKNLVYSGVRSSTFDGVISGSGGVTLFQGGFTTTLTGANNYSGATTINSGTLAAGASNSLSADSAFNLTGAGATLALGGTTQTIASLAGSNAGSIVSLGAGGTLGFGAANASTSYAGKFAGSGAFTKNGTGTFTLGGDSSAFTGTAEINGGTLTVNAGAKLNGTQNINNGATLVANGTVSGITNLHSGGLLQGSGTLGGLSVSGGGILAPGSAGSALTVNGNLGFDVGSIFRVAATPATADRVNAAGAITITGGTVDVQAGGTSYARNTTYTILNSTGARSGVFDNVTSNLAFLTPTLTYDNNNVYLTLVSSNASGGYSSVAATANQASVANYLNGFGNNPGNAQAQALTQLVDNLTPAQARQAFASMSGTQHAGATQVGQALTHGFVDSVNGHLNSAGDPNSFNGVGSLKGSAFALSSPATLWGVSGDTPTQMAAMFAGNGMTSGAASLSGVPAGGYSGNDADGNADARDTGRAASGDAGLTRGTWGANTANQNGLWGQALGSGGRIRGDGNGAGSDYRAGGFMVGYDKSLSKNWLVGVAGGYNRANWNASLDGAAPASGKVETPQGAVYARYSSGPVMLSFAGSYADHKFDTNRTVTIGTASSVAASEHHGQEWGFSAQAEYALAAGAWQLRPLAGLRYAHLREDGFTETGATAGANLGVDARTTDNTTLSTGVRVLRAFNAAAPGNGGFELRAIYSHLFGDNDAPITARLAGQAASFTSTGTPLKRDAMTFGAGVAASLGHNFNGFIDTSYEVRGSGQNAVAIGAGVKYLW